MDDTHPYHLGLGPDLGPGPNLGPIQISAHPDPDPDPVLWWLPEARVVVYDPVTLGQPSHVVQPCNALDAGVPASHVGMVRAHKGGIVVRELPLALTNTLGDEVKAAEDEAHMALKMTSVNGFIEALLEGNDKGDWQHDTTLHDAWPAVLPFLPDDDACVDKVLQRVRDIAAFWFHCPLQPSLIPMAPAWWLLMHIRDTGVVHALDAPTIQAALQTSTAKPDQRAAAAFVMVASTPEAPQRLLPWKHLTYDGHLAWGAPVEWLKAAAYNTTLPELPLATAVALVRCLSSSTQLPHVLRNQPFHVDLMEATCAVVDTSITLEPEHLSERWALDFLPVFSFLEGRESQVSQARWDAMRTLPKKCLAKCLGKKRYGLPFECYSLDSDAMTQTLKRSTAMDAGP